MARPRRTASTAQQEAQAPEDAQAQPTQEAATVTEAPKTTQESEVTTVTEIPAEQPAEAQPESIPEQAQAEQEVPAQAEQQSAEGAATGDTSAQAAQPAAAEESTKTPEELYQAFKDSLEHAFENADESTGTPAEIDSAAALKAFRELPNTQKKADAKAWLGEEMIKAMNADQIPRARTFMEVNRLVNEASARRAAATPSAPAKSPTELYIEQRLALDLAGNFLAAPKELDSEKFQNDYAGLKQELTPQIQTYQTWLFNLDTENRGDEPEVHDVIKQAAKIAAGKATRKSGGARRASTDGSTAGGPRGDVAKHIAEFLETVESGTDHPISAFAKFKSSQYPEGTASAGAISSRLFPKDGKPTNIPGVQPLADSTPKKVRKL